MIIRTAAYGEEEALWNMMNSLDYETPFMMYEPGERKKNLEIMKNRICQAADGRDLLMVAQEPEHGELAGFISAERGRPERTKHTAYIVIGIRAAYCGRGTGRRLLKEAGIWAENNGITRLELTVVCRNHAAVHLYQSCGFKIEGRRCCSMRSCSQYDDEFYMAKLLGDAAAVSKEESHGTVR